LKGGGNGGRKRKLKAEKLKLEIGIAKGERVRRASSVECKRGKAEIKKLEIGKVGKWPLEGKNRCETLRKAT
jgi:Tfp pilus assembly protein FimT